MNRKQHESQEIMNQKKIMSHEKRKTDENLSKPYEKSSRKQAKDTS